MFIAVVFSAITMCREMSYPRLVSRLIFADGDGDGYGSISSSQQGISKSQVTANGDGDGDGSISSSQQGISKSQVTANGDGDGSISTATDQYPAASKESPNLK